MGPERPERAAHYQRCCVTELSCGQAVHRRAGTAVAVAIISFSIGLLVALSKSEKHYIGVVWDAGDGKKADW